MNNEAANQVIEVASTGGWEPLLLALALLVGAAALLVLEFFIVSFGLLLAASLACVAGAIYFAFQAGDVAGWVVITLVPPLGYFISRWGLRRIQTAGLIKQTEIRGEAGYHHFTDSLGIAPGSLGVMVTPARPSGRARFSGGECDVQMTSGVLEVGNEVTVERIEGAVVYVLAVPANAVGVGDV
jgi:membrane-bound ClpP family serine protease